MHRTEGTNHASNLFTNGPPATTIEDNWLNSIQEEIAYVIEQAGLTLDTASTNTRTQLKAGLDVLYAARADAPAATGSDGTAGQIAYDAGFIYQCVAANTWKRVAIAAW